MNVQIGNFKQNKYREVALNIRQAVLDYAEEHHCSLIEAMGILECVKFDLYLEQVAIEVEEDDE
jgi:hypothetical protein